MVGGTGWWLSSQKLTYLMYGVVEACLKWSSLGRPKVELE